MKLTIRILCALLCAAFIVVIPFFLSSPPMLHEARDLLNKENEDDEDEDLDFGGILFPSAIAEDFSEESFSMEDEEIEDPIGKSASLSIPDDWELPIDFSVPPMPDPDGFTENGYEDQSIRVRVEEREMKESVVHIAFVEIASPSQLRTATAYGVKSGRALEVVTIAKKNHVVIAMNGDCFIKDIDKKKFEVRMKQIVDQEKKRYEASKAKDSLVIDTNGDFRTFLASEYEELKQYKKDHKDDIVNAFMFGPVLVKDGVIPDMEREYGYNRTGREPRSAIGQTGPLSYVMVVVEARGKSKGVSQPDLAEIMLELGCIQAYNLDGGNSAEMIMIGPDPDHLLLKVRGDQQANPRGQSDIIYFATAVPEDERQ